MLRSYLKALLHPQPLHFGDYGGMPLKIIWALPITTMVSMSSSAQKIIWALLDMLTIVVIGSGLYVWWAGRRNTLRHRRNALQAVAKFFLTKSSS
jgi:uncharacterized iron-regulated membrane protein